MVDTNRMSLPGRLVAFAFSICLIFQPVIVAAEAVVDSSNASKAAIIDRAANGVEVVHITAPSAAGVSHNQFLKFNVSESGIILNNSAEVSISQLGGAVNFNPNLQNSSAATLILNEVTAANRSQLNGYTEITGQSAEYILANPYGITCSGCGFINTPKATLTTGTPLMNAGVLQGLSVNGGDILINGLGLDASRVDHFSLITRATEVNAALVAKNLNLVLGRNDVDQATGAVTAKADDGSVKPTFALDASALGGMYANQISLIGTEAGVGVRMAGSMAADAGDVTINADGSLQLAQVQSSRDIKLESRSSDITISGLTYAGQDLDLDAAGTVTLDNLTAAKRHARIDAAGLNQNSVLVAGLNADYSINTQGQLDVAISGVYNNSGQTMAGAALNVTSQRLNNTGSFQASGHTTIQSTTVSNSGVIQSQGHLSITGDTLDNSAGVLLSNLALALQMTGAVNNQGGNMTAGTALSVNALSLNNAGGVIKNAGGLEMLLNLSGQLNNTAGLISSNSEKMTIAASGLINRDTADVGGLLGIKHNGTGTLLLSNVNLLDNQNGRLVSNGHLQATIANAINNQGGSIGAKEIDLTANSLNNQAGLLEAQRLALNVTTNLQNMQSGVISAYGTAADSLSLNVGGELNNATGLLHTNAASGTWTMGSLVNDGGRVLHAGTGLLRLNVTNNVSNTAGRIEGLGHLNLSAANINNAGRIASESVTLNTTALNNNSGVIQASNGLQLTADSLSNDAGVIASVGVDDSIITIANALDNSGGLIQSNANNFTLSAATLNNNTGVINHAGTGLLTLTTTGDLNNSAGRIAGNNNISINSLGLNNQGGLISAAQQLLITALADIDNGVLLGGAGGVLEGRNNFSLSAVNLLNTGGWISSQGDGANITGSDITLSGLLNNSAGLIQSGNTHLSLSAAEIDNRNAGRVLHGGSGLLNLTAGTLRNQGVSETELAQIVSNGAITVTADYVYNNAHASLAANDVMTLSIQEVLDNSDGTLQTGAALALNARSLNNSNGDIIAAGTGDSSIVTFRGINNSNGRIQSNAINLNINAGIEELLNELGSIVHVGEGRLDLRVSRLTNAGGQIASNGSLVTTGIGTLTNSKSGNTVGTLLAKRIDLNAGTFNNTGGAVYATGTEANNINVTTLNNTAGGLIHSAENMVVYAYGGLNNSGGVLQSQKDLTLQLIGFDPNQTESQINAGMNLIINMSNDLVNNAGNQLLALNNLEINTLGNIHNHGEISTGGNLTLKADELTNYSNAILSAGGHLTLSMAAIGKVTNQANARMSSEYDLNINAANLNNHGLVAAGQNLITNVSQNLNNYNTLFAAGSMGLYVTNELYNHAGANIFALNDIWIAKDDTNARAARLINESATIEAFSGSINFYANEVTNRRAAGALTYDEAISQTVQSPNFRERYSYQTPNNSPRPPDTVSEYGTSKVAFSITRRKTDAPAAASMVAGQDIQGEFTSLLNQNSSIAADRHIAFSGTSLRNEGTDLYRQVRTSRLRQDYILMGAEPMGQGSYLADYEADGSPVVTANLGESSEVYDYIRATIFAGGTFSGSFTGQLDNVTIKQNAGDAVNTHQTQTTTAKKRDLSVYTPSPGPLKVAINEINETGGTTGTTVGLLTGGVSAESANPQLTGLTQFVFNPADNLTLPSGGGLFVVNPDPDSAYLVETNSALTRLDYFLGSDYLSSQVPIDPAITTRRLGDAFYETRLIRDAILAATGRRYLDESITNDYDQMKYLMDNAVAAQEELSLAYGIALTPDQVARLTHDIIWMVEQEVQGHIVLVPVFYASALRWQDMDRAGAMIAGQVLSIEADTVSSNGLLSGTDLVNIETAQGLLNEGIIASAPTGNVMLVARAGDIANQGGLISGGSVGLLASAGGLLNSPDGVIRAERQLNVQVHDDIALNRNSGTLDSRGHMSLQSTGGSITIGNQDYGQFGLTVGGHLSLDAKRDLTLIDSVLNTGGDLSLSGDNINLVARRFELERKVTRGRNENINRTVTHRVSELNANGSILLNASNDINSEAAQFIAGRDIVLAAEGDINLNAVQNETYAYSKKVKKKSFGRSTTTITEDYTVDSQGTQLVAGGNVLMNIQVNEDGSIGTSSSGSVNLEGTQISAGGSTLIAADEDVNIFAAQTFEYHREEKHKKGTFGLKKTNTGSIFERQGLAASTLVSTNDLSVMSGDNITIVGSDLVAGGDINLEAYNDVLISAGQVTESEEQWSETTSMFSGGSLYEKDTSRQGVQRTLAQGSMLDAGNNINIVAGSATVIGSDLVAGNSINAQTDVGDIEVLAAVETEDSYSHEKRVAISMGDALASLTNPNDMVSTDNGQITIKMADASYDAVDTSSAAITHRASNFVANNNIVLDSAGDILIEGSNLTGDADQSGEGTVALMADADIIIKEAENVLEETSKETHGTAELSVVVQHQAAEVIKAALAVKDAKDGVKKAKKEYRQYKKDRKKLESELATLEEAYKNKEPGVTFDDLSEMRELVEDVHDDEDWYKAGVVLAAVNLASKITGLVQQVTAAAQSTGTYGFNAGLQLDIEATKTQSSSKETTSLASNISGHNILLQTGSDAVNIEDTTTTIQGSHLNAADTLAIDTGTLNILASKDTTESKSEMQKITASIQQTVYGAAGGPSVSGSIDRSQEKNRSTTWNNSTLGANTININTTGDTNINGGNVHADSALIANIGGDLNLVSKQNRSSSSSKGIGISGGFSLGASGTGNSNTLAGAAQNIGQTNGNVSGQNGGINASNGRSQTRTTVLSSLTSGGTADITVAGNTDIVGALLGTIDSEGNDLGQLNLATNSLTYTDLTNSGYSSDQSVSVSGSAGSSSWQYSNSSNVSKGKTLATLGTGNINIADTENSSDLSLLNRDTANTDKEFFNVDRQQGNINVKIDHRMLTEEGREKIKNDFVDSYEFGEDIVTAASKLNQSDELGLLNFWSALHNNAQATQLKNDLLRNPSNHHILEGMKSGDPSEYALAMQQLGNLAQDKFGLSLSDVTLYDADTTTSASLGDKLLYDVKGGTVLDADNANFGNIFIDVGDGVTKTDMVNTLGHEVIETNTLQNGESNDAAQEALADAFGDQFSDRINQAADGDLDSTGGDDFSQNLVTSETVALGSQLANTVGNAQVDHRRIKESEAKILDGVRSSIGTDPSLSSEERELALTQLNALACAAVDCVGGVSSDDPLYESLAQLQALGEQLNDEGISLGAMLGEEHEGEFEHGFKDSFDDLLTSTDESIVRTVGAGRTVAGAMGMFGGSTMTVGFGVACGPTAGLACAGIPLGAGLTYLGYDEAKAGIDLAFGDYAHLEGQGVINALSTVTHTGDVDPTLALAIRGSIGALEVASAKVGSKILDKGIERYRKHKADKMYSGLGDLEVEEAKKIQAGVENLQKKVDDLGCTGYQCELSVVGSATRNERREIGSDLPIGHDAVPGVVTTRSDIDYVLKNREDFDPLLNRGPFDAPQDNPLYNLPDVDPHQGIMGGPIDPSETSILFRAGQPPKVITPLNPDSADAKAVAEKSKAYYDSIQKTNTGPTFYYGPFYHLGDPKENVDAIKSSGVYRGNRPTNSMPSDIPKVQVYDGYLPDSATHGFQFYTPAKPDLAGTPGQPTWSGEHFVTEEVFNPDVKTINNKAVIPCVVTKVAPCSQ